SLGRVGAAMIAQGISSGEGSSGVDPDACFQQSLLVFQQIGAPGEQGHTLRAWAQFQLERGQPEQGRKLCEEARDTFSRPGTTGQVERMDAASPPLETRALV